MKLKNIISKPILKKIWNILFIALILFFIFSPGAKSWMLQQMISVGLFKAEIKIQDTSKVAMLPDVSFSYTDAKGIIVSTSELKGKVVFINFWATWCPPCRAEMPSLNELYNKFKNDTRFAFVFINEDDELVKAENYLQRNKFDLPLYAPAGNIPQEIFNGTLPTTIVINKEGKIVLKHEGMAGYNTSDFIKQLKDLL